jgi:hypothetical protein
LNLRDAVALPCAQRLLRRERGPDVLLELRQRIALQGHATAAALHDAAIF